MRREAAGVPRPPRGARGPGARRARPATGPCATWSRDLRDYPAEVHELAARSVTAHLLKLRARRAVRKNGRGASQTWVAPAAGRVRSLRPAGAWARPVLRVVLARPAPGRSHRLRLTGVGDEPQLRPDHVAAAAPAIEHATCEQHLQRAVRRLPGRAHHRSDVILRQPDRDGRALGRGVADPTREIEQSPLDPLRDAEPGELGSRSCSPGP